MQDISLKEVLASHGFEGSAAEAGLEVLRRCGLASPRHQLTGAGKTRVAVSKLDDIAKALATEFIRVCHKPVCAGQATRDDRAAVDVSPQYCDVCGGEENRRAVNGTLDVMRRTGRRKLLVAGGSPGTREELIRLCGADCELRFISENDRPTRALADSHSAWADVIVIWASTEIGHKWTATLKGRDVITVARRGIAALADGVTRFLAG